MIIYHGSKEIVSKPEYGKGKVHNDYGQGFYCTEHLELAKEWACDSISGGYSNKYELDDRDLRILNLNDNEYGILNWITILLQNRQFELSNEISIKAKKYLIENFSIDTKGVDVIIGYRADDSYFSYAKEFLQNNISVQKLNKAMKLGTLGNQVVLISQKAFSKLTFIGYEEVSQEEYYPLRKARDEKARSDYFSDKEDDVFDSSKVFVLDIIRNEMKANDPRLQ